MSTCNPDEISEGIKPDDISEDITPEEISEDIKTDCNKSYMMEITDCDTENKVIDCYDSSKSKNKIEQTVSGNNDVVKTPLFDNGQNSVTSSEENVNETTIRTQIKEPEVEEPTDKGNTADHNRLNPDKPESAPKIKSIYASDEYQDKNKIKPKSSVSKEEYSKNIYLYHYFRQIFQDDYLLGIKKEYWKNYMSENNFNQKLLSGSYLFQCRVDPQTSYKFIAAEFLTLAVHNQQLIGNILDLIIGYHCRNLPVKYVETTATEVLRYTTETTPSPFEEDKNLVMAVYNLPLSEYCAHWIFFMFDKKTRSLYVIDPFFNSVKQDLGNNLLQWFTEIHHGQGSMPGINKCREIYSCDPEPKDWNFTEYDWSIQFIRHTPQTDLTSCGMFCIEFSLAILENYPNIPDFIYVDDLRVLRCKHTKKFLELAEKVDH